MKLKSVLFITMGFFAFSAICLQSCKTRERDTDTTEGEESLLLTRTNDDVVSIVAQAEQGILANYGCATITNNTSTLPTTMEIDFGAGACICQDGKIRNGKILVSYDGAFNELGSTRTVSFNNYTVDTAKVSGIKTIKNLGPNGNTGNMQISISSMDTIVKKANAGTVTGILEQNREYTAGFNTVQWSDDRYLLTGTIAGKRANGFNFAAKISKPIVVDFTCKYRLVSGEMQIQPQARDIRILSLGDGTCDKSAALFINNKAYNIDFE